MKKGKGIIKMSIIFAILFIIVILLAYVYNFRNNCISKSPEDWANFADYLGILNIIISVISMIIFYCIPFRIVEIEEDRSKRERMPLGNFTFEISEESLKIIYSNCGLGPMIIESIEIYKEKNIVYNSFGEMNSIRNEGDFSYITELISSKTKVALNVGENKILLDLKIDTSKTNYREKINKLRKELSDYEIVIKYKGIYGDNTEEIRETLSSLSTDLLR